MKENCQILIFASYGNGYVGQLLRGRMPGDRAVQKHEGENRGGVMCCPCVGYPGSDVVAYEVEALLA